LAWTDASSGRGAAATLAAGVPRSKSPQPSSLSSRFGRRSAAAGGATSALAEVSWVSSSAIRAWRPWLLASLSSSFVPSSCAVASASSCPAALGASAVPKFRSPQPSLSPRFARGSAAAAGATVASCCSSSAIRAWKAWRCSSSVAAASAASKAASAAASAASSCF